MPISFEKSPTPWSVEIVEKESGTTGLVILDAAGEDVCRLYVDCGACFIELSNAYENAKAIVQLINGTPNDK